MINLDKVFSFWIIQSLTRNICIEFNQLYKVYKKKKIDKLDYSKFNNKSLFYASYPVLYNYLKRKSDSKFQNFTFCPNYIIKKTLK